MFAFRVYGLGFGVYGTGVQDLWFRIWVCQACCTLF